MRLLPIFILTYLILLLSCGNDTISDGGGLETETISNISGTIVNTDGDSVENAIIVATKTDTNNIVISSDTVLTNEKGFYHFTTLDTGLFTFEATKEINNLNYTAFIGQHYNDSTDIYLGIDTLLATGYIGGNVITDEISTHYMGIEIYIPGTSFSAHSDSAGDFIISSVPIGNHLIAFDEPGFSIYTCNTSIDYPGDTAWLESVILTKVSEDKYFKIYGSLLSFDGSIASNANVSLSEVKDSDSVVYLKSVFSDESGYYSFDSLSNGTYIIYASINNGIQLLSFTSENIIITDQEINIGIDTLKTLHTIIGTALKEDENNHVGIEIIIPGTSFSARSDSSGMYVLLNIPNGNYNLIFRTPDYLSDTCSVSITNTTDTTIMDTVLLLKDTIDIIDTVYKIKMIDITGSSFTDAPGKNAGVSNFSISETEITLGQYKEFDPTWINLSGTNNSNEPVAGISLSECFRFCNWLSKKEGLDTCFIIDSTRKATRVYGDSTYWELDTSASGYRIPSGDEWEFAAKGGKNYKYATYNGEIEQGSSPATSNAWIPSVAKDKIQKVKFFQPNPFNLYDMTGNVWEYTWEADYLTKPNGRFNYFDDSETMNDEHIKVRGESAIYPISSPGLSWQEMQVDRCHTANSKTQHFFSNKARGFRIVKR